MLVLEYGQYFIMDDQQRQRLAAALHEKRLSFRRASLAPRDHAGAPLLGQSYVREAVNRGRGSKEFYKTISKTSNSTPQRSPVRNHKFILNMGFCPCIMGKSR